MYDAFRVSSTPPSSDRPAKKGGYPGIGRVAIVGERFGGRKPAVPISPAVQSVGKPGSDGGGLYP